MMPNGIGGKRVKYLSEYKSKIKIQNKWLQVKIDSHTDEGDCYTCAAVTTDKAHWHVSEI